MRGGGLVGHCRSVRIWNLKSSKALATLRLPATSGAPRVAYDPTGKVLAATYLETSPGMEGGGGTNIIKLYDARNYGTGWVYLNSLIPG